MTEISTGKSAVNKDSVVTNELNDQEGIAAADVICCFVALRSAAVEKIAELCNQLDHDDTISVNDLKNIIQVFAENERNSFSEDPDDDSQFLNSTGNLEGCGGDVSAVSIVEHDVGELLLRNKNLSHINSNIRRENIDLRKQLELYDEECDAQRQMIIVLQRDLRHFQENKPDFQELLTEKDEVQSHNMKLQEEIEVLVAREKVIKEETGDYRKTLTDLQDKHDNLCALLEEEKEKNDQLELDLHLLQDKYQESHLKWETEKEETAGKLKQIVVLEERLNLYEEECEALKEDNRLLSEQIRESQLEYSIFQRTIGESGLGTVQSSIDQELTIADTSLNGKYVLSPICGTNFRSKLFHHTSLSEELQRNICLKVLQNSPEEMNGEYPIYAQNGFKSLMNDVEIQTVGVDIHESNSQTEITSLHDDILLNKSFDSMAEENEVFIETSAQIQEDIRHKNAEILELQSMNHSLEMELEREKNNSKHWRDLSLENHKLVDRLQKELFAEQDKVLHLSGIKAGLSSSQLDLWWDEYMKKRSHQKSVDHDNENAEVLPNSSRLIESLCLMNPLRKMVNAGSESQLHGQQLSTDFYFENEEATIGQIVQFCDMDAMTYEGRMKLLKVCRGMTEEALSAKCSDLMRMVRGPVLSDSLPVETEKGQKSVADVRRVVESIHALSSKVGEIEKCVGAREEERKVKSVMEVGNDAAFNRNHDLMMKNMVKSCEDKCREMKRKVRQILKFDAKCHCQCKEEMLSLDTDDGFKTPAAAAVADLSSQFSDAEKTLKRAIDTKMSVFQKILLGTGFLTWVFPSRLRLMMVIFFICVLMTMRPCDYRVPTVI